MNKLTLLLLLATACGDSNTNKPTPDAPVTQPPDAAAATCFSGTASTHDQLINACVDQSVTVIHKAPMLPLLNADGSLPPLP